MKKSLYDNPQNQKKGHKKQYDQETTTMSGYTLIKTFPCSFKRELNSNTDVSPDSSRAVFNHRTYKGGGGAIVNLETGVEQGLEKREFDSLYLKWSKCGSYISSGGDSASIFDSTTGQAIFNFPKYNSNIIRNTAWCGYDTNLVAGTCADSCVRIFDLRMKTSISQLPVTYDKYNVRAVDVDWSDSNGMLVCCSSATLGSYGSKIITIINPKTGTVCDDYDAGDEQTVGCVSWSPDSKFISATINYKSILIIKPGCSERTKIALPYLNSFDHVEWSPDGKEFLICGPVGQESMIITISDGRLSMLPTQGHARWLKGCGDASKKLMILDDGSLSLYDTSLEIADMHKTDWDGSSVNVFLLDVYSVTVVPLRKREIIDVSRKLYKAGKDGAEVYKEMEKIREKLYGPLPTCE